MVINYIGVILKFIIGTQAIIVSGNSRPVMPESLIFFGLLITITGIISIVYPRLFWYLRVGRKLQGAPPQKLYLHVLRFGGVLATVLGLVIIYHALAPG